MALDQMRAVSNRRIRPKIVDAINAQTPYLPQLYQQKEDKAYKTKLYDQSERSMALGEKGLAQQGEIARRNEAFAYDQLEEQKKQNKTAKKLGYANIGIGGLSGLAGLYQATQPLKGMDFTPELSEVAKDAVPYGDGLSSFAEAFSTPAAPVTDAWDYSDAFTQAPSVGADQTSFFGGVGDFVTDYAVEPIKQFGGAIWDAGSSFLDDIGGLFS
jgi:hypothetical protein